METEGSLGETLGKVGGRGDLEGGGARPVVQERGAAGARAACAQPEREVMGGWTRMTGWQVVDRG